MTLRLNCSPLRDYRILSPDIHEILVKEFTKAMSYSGTDVGMGWNSTNVDSAFMWSSTPQEGDFWSYVDTHDIEDALEYL